MASVLIIGFGNTLRGDDAIGPLAAAALQGLKMRGVDVIQRPQIAPELAESLALSEAVIFVDAAVGRRPGSIRCAEVIPAAPESGFTHMFTPSALLALTQALYGAAPRAIEVTLAAESFELSTELSAAVQQELPRLIAFVNEQAKALAERSATMDSQVTQECGPLFSPWRSRVAGRPPCIPYLTIRRSTRGGSTHSRCAESPLMRMP